MNSPTEIRLLLIDDHSVVRMGLAAVLEAADAGLRVVAQEDGGENVIDAIRSSEPDVILLDIRMPRMNGIETLKVIRADFPQAKVLMLSTSSFEEDFAQAMEAGASGYVLKTSQPEELVEAIRAVHAGEIHLSAEIEEALKARPQRRSFTPREFEVLDLLRRGLTNRDIGLALGITENTAKTHVKALFLKLEAADRAEAVARAFDRGLLRVNDES